LPCRPLRDFKTALTLHPLCLNSSIAAASIASVSLASVAAFAAPTGTILLGLQTFTGTLGGLPSRVTETLPGTYVAGVNLPTTNLLTALTESCQDQRNLCNLQFLFISTADCTTQFNRCVAVAQTQVASLSSASVASV